MKNQVKIGLTLDQPFASLMAAGVKTIENRSWAPDAGTIGQRVAIHAGKTYDHLGSFMVRNDHGIICFAARCPRGAIVATAQLVAVVTHSTDPWFRGPYGWVFDDVISIQPLPCPGARNLWALPVHVRDQLRQVERQPSASSEFFTYESESKLAATSLI